MWRKTIHEYPNINGGKLSTRDDFVKLTRDPWLAAMTPTNITSGFKRCGIWPLSLDVILEGCVGEVAVNDAMPIIAHGLKISALLHRTHDVEVACHWVWFG